MPKFKSFLLSIEAVVQGLKSLTVNKTRTTLSLTGITIGIFAIITVFAAVDSLEANIRKNLNKLGNNVVYIQKWPWAAGGDYPWWKYLNRPETSYQDYLDLRQRLTLAERLVYMQSASKTIHYKGNQVSDAGVLMVTHDYNVLWDVDFAQGRYFTENESKSGSPVCILGADVAEGLFAQANPIGKEVKLLGQKMRVIGLMERKGKSLIGDDTDGSIIVPVRWAQKVMGSTYSRGAMVMAKPQEGVPLKQFKNELQGAMRSIRRLKPKADDNFALNEMSLISNSVEMIFRTLTITGSFIGGFSILVGGFGIANIMFVSVKERTSEIGIQKSLGAPSRFILIQFLAEAVSLCIVGGIFGLILVFAAVQIAGQIIDFPFYLSAYNIVLGLIISSLIGLVSGFVPALSASRLNPVEAIRRGM
jgi:putative ABC transport system permease protein